MNITPMALDHIPSLAAIEKACFSTPWSKEAFQEEYQNPNAFFLVAIDGAKVLGYIGCHMILDEGYIANVAVLPAYHRKGVAHALLKQLIQKAKARKLSFLTLEVRVSNLPAILLYTGAGFKPAGMRRGYYSNPREDACIMTLSFETKISHTNL